MEVFRGPVSVTPSPPLDSPAGYLFYYAAIHPVAVAQSVVLSSILESCGDAQLPRGVSQLEFELWQKAVVDRHAGDCSKDEVDLDMSSLCAVLKVRHEILQSMFTDSPSRSSAPECI